MYSIDRLSQHWQKNCQLGSISTQNKSEIELVFQLLVTAYTQPDRHYHNLDHIFRILANIRVFANVIQNPRSLIFAAWFHDFVYDSQASDNEIKSAKLAGAFLRDIGESIELIDRVEQLILATVEHRMDISDNDLCIFLDADLEILGENPDRYQVYARSIRREYSWVSDELYRAGRIRVLESFLDRDRLYHTRLFFEIRESIARDNLQQEILSLKSGDFFS
jgi:predicted metal-dependent HD superfamily phosphohydrolase